ncbi:MAG: ACT domain-containing protein [Armatimonadota bacterium]|nr:ACT domain-containing protein [Armatimonadota bacterium]MDW8156559.1 ACT domain-containing protein [Armatimonadota bacterium]
MDARVAQLLARTKVVVQPDRLVWVSLPPSERGRLQRRADRFHSPFCLTFSAREVSVVCREVEWDQVGKGLRPRAVQRGYRMVTLDAELDLDVVGYLKVVTEHLARAGVPVSVVSTFHRDHLLVREEDLPRAQALLEALVRECAGMPAAPEPSHRPGGGEP